MNLHPIRRFSSITVILAGIFVLALALRLWGSAFGLPYEYHVDENQYVRQAASMGSNGLKPADWYNPPFFKYILLAEYGAFYAVGKLAGVFSSTADFGARMTVDPTWLYLLGRWTSAVMGALAVLVIFWTGKKAYNARAGLLAAFLFAVAFLPVREAHFAVNDAAATLWVVLVLLAAVGIDKNGGWRWYLLGGAALGLGLATKYHTLAAAVPLAVAHLYAIRRLGFLPSLKKGAAALAAFAAAAVAASPYFLITPREVWNNLSALIWSGQYGFVGWQIDPSGGFLFYLKTLLWGLGWALSAACLLGIAAGFWRRRSVDIILLSLPVFLFLFLGRQKMFFGRFMLPLIPSLLLVASGWIEETAARYQASKTLPRAALVIIALALTLQPLINSIQFNVLLSRADTRTIAKSWIEANIPNGAGVALDWQFQCPELSTAERPVADSSRTYRTWTADFVVGKGLSDHPLEWYRQQGYQYLVACSFIYRLPLADPAANNQRNAFYTALDQQMALIEEIRPARAGTEPPFQFDELYGPVNSMPYRDLPGPTIKIYQFK